MPVGECSLWPAVLACLQGGWGGGTVPSPIGGGCWIALAVQPQGLRRECRSINHESGRGDGTQRLLAGGPGAGRIGTGTLLSTDNLQFTFNCINWVNNERLVISTRYPDFREIDWLPEDGKYVLLTLPANELNTYPAVFKVNVYTAERTGYSNSKEQVSGWMTDRSHRVRVGVGRTFKGERTIWSCDPDGENWRLIRQTLTLSAEALWPMGFGLDPHLLYVRATHEGLAAFFVLDLRQPEAKPQLKLAHPRYDLDGSLVRDQRGEAVGVRRMAFGDSSSFYWDERYKEAQVALDEALPDRFSGLYDMSRDRRTFIVRSEEPGWPQCYYLGQFGEQPRMELQAEGYLELEGQVLAGRRSFDMKARDGMEESSGQAASSDHAAARRPSSEPSGVSHPAVLGAGVLSGADAEGLSLRPAAICWPQVAAAVSARRSQSRCRPRARCTRSCIPRPWRRDSASSSRSSRAPRGWRRSGCPRG